MSRRKRTRASQDGQSIEEVLHGAHAQFALLEDLFYLHAVGPRLRAS